MMAGALTDGGAVYHSGHIPQRRSKYVPEGARRCRECGSLVRKGHMCRKCKDARDARSVVGEVRTYYDEGAKTAEAQGASERRYTVDSCGNVRMRSSLFGLELVCDECGRRYRSMSNRMLERNLCDRCRPHRCMGCGSEFSQPKMGKMRKYCYTCRPTSAKEKGAE